jgi:hypothetical protein
MIYAYGQYEAWLRESGFRDVSSMRCGSWTPHGIVQAFKQDRLDVVEPLDLRAPAAWP